MFRALGALGTFARTAASFAMLGLLGLGGWLGYNFYHQRDSGWKAALEEQKAENEKLRGENTQLAKANEELQTRLRLLKVDDRVARIRVIDQRTPLGAERVQTRIEFTELGDDGEPLHDPKVFQVDGDRIYIEALVAKFKDEFVEEGNPLRGKSIYWFRSIYGKYQQPADGYPLDPPGRPPLPYRSGDELSEFEQKIWGNFWEIANDPAELEALGVRSAGGEAPYMDVVQGGRYRVELRASGGLSWVVEKPGNKPDAT